MAGTKTVTASLVIDFTTAEGEGILTAEVDSREEGYNAGDTNFTVGSEPVFLIYKSSNVVLDKIASSEGTLVLLSSAVGISDSEWLTYANEKSANPKHPVVTGTVTDSAGLTGTPTVGEVAVTFAEPQIGVVQLDYTTQALAYRLAGASGTRPVVIYIAGHTV